MGREQHEADGASKDPERPDAALELPLDDLPPLDGDENDVPSLSGADLADDAAELAEDADGADPFDDSTGEGDPIEELAEEERSWLTDAEPAEGLDLGAMDLLDDPSLRHAIGDDEELGAGDEDFGLLDEAAPTAFDGGEEGPSEPDEELRETDLPELDADEEGDLDDAILADVPLDDDAPLPWDAHPWERAGMPLEIGPVLAIACNERGVLAKVGKVTGGDTTSIVRVDLEGGAEVVPEGEDDLLGAAFPDGDPPSQPSRLLGEELGFLSRSSSKSDFRITAEARASGGDVLIALVSRVAGRAWLLRVGLGCPARILAEVGGAAFGDDPEILALAWDDTRKVAWVGGLFGLLAFQPHANLRGEGGGRLE